MPAAAYDCNRGWQEQIISAKDRNAQDTIAQCIAACQEASLHNALHRYDLYGGVTVRKKRYTP
jgi:hypothetical protein